MKLFLKQLAGSLSLTLLFSLLLFPQAKSMEYGFYIGFGGSYTSPAPGSFNGNSSLGSELEPDITIDIPKLSHESSGFSGRFGLKAMMWALEFQFAQTIFDKAKSNIDQLEGRLFVSQYDLNIKYYLIEQHRAGLYGIFGLGYSTLAGERIKRTGVDPDYSYSTTTFAGVVGNIGIGIDFYLTRELFLYGEYIYRANAYSVVDNLDIVDEYGYSDPLNQPYHSVYFGVAYALPY